MKGYRFRPRFSNERDFLSGDQVTVRVQINTNVTITINTRLQGTNKRT
jgi:hypothetical protein